jgi:MFS family permease
MRQVPRVALLALAVGLVLADGSVVALGLPDVLVDFGVSPEAVSWVLTGYNLALAVAALPAALLLERSPAPGTLAVGGLLVFAAASLVCALAPSLGVLIAARCVQGLAGAAVAGAALVLLVDATGGRATGAAIWGAAGAIGAAVGPAAGGLLTEGLSWEAIFAVQIPLALVCVPAMRGAPATSVAPSGSASPPDTRHLLALACLGAGLTAALFLLVMLLIAGWRVSPIAAALTVSVMPAGALLASRIPFRDPWMSGATGAVLIAGGLAGLAMMPGAEIGWTLVPQAFVGLGLGLSLGPVTEAALHGREPLVRHGGWALAARHAGVVAALAILTPIFTADLETQEDRAKEAVLAQVLDSPLQPTTKLDVGLALADQMDTAGGRVPDVGKAFEEASGEAGEAARLAELETSVGDELDRAATTAFERSFLVGALLTFLAVIPLLLPGGERRTLRSEAARP